MTTARASLSAPSSGDKDYLDVGVCRWRDWSLEVACWLHDPLVGDPPANKWQLRSYLREVRRRPFNTNPWRRYFARDNMTPFEAIRTLQRGQ